MSTFRKLWQALESLADAIGHLAATVQVVSSDIRQRAGIEEPHAPPVIDQPALPEPSPNGHEHPEPVKPRARK